MQRYNGTGLISVQEKEKSERVSGFADENHIANTTGFGGRDSSLDGISQSPH